MNRHLVETAVALAAVAMLAAGCGGKKGPAGAGGLAGIDDGEYGLTTVIDDENGLAMTGMPFDQTGTPVTDVAIAPVYFGYDSFQLPGDEIAKIQQAADVLRRNPGYVLIVEGHCDERGSNEYNLSLGEQRALAVRNYIVNIGIDAQRIQSRSFGEERPAVAGTGEEAWRLNRRGEFAFYK